MQEALGIKCCNDNHDYDDDDDDDGIDEDDDDDDDDDDDGDSDDGAAGVDVRQVRQSNSALTSSAGQPDDGIWYTLYGQKLLVKILPHGKAQNMPSI